MRVVAKQSFRIAGSGSYLPTGQVTSEELDTRCGMAQGWCKQHVGVETRHECLPPESMISMGCEAIGRALQNAQLEWSDVDCLIDCSTSQYRPIPCNAAHYQHQIGIVAHGIPCFDIHSTCLGSLVSINILNGMFQSRSYRNVILVASESALAGVNYAEPQSACLMGDGAAALVLSHCETDATFGFSHLTFAEHIELCRVEGGGHKQSVFDYDSNREAEYRFTMDGPAVFRVALQYLKPMVVDLLEAWQSATSIERDSLHWVPHQASPRALRAVQRMFQVRDSNFHVAVSDVGNMVAASLPFMIDRVRRSGAVGSGSSVLALGTSAGYSQAAIIFQL